jgi:hypothetical protein
MKWLLKERNPNEQCPWLHLHYKDFLATTTLSATAWLIGTIGLEVAFLSLSLHIAKRLLPFHNKALSKGRAISTPDTIRPVNRSSALLIPPLPEHGGLDVIST